MVQHIRPRELAQRLAAGEPVVLLDVRQAWEHDTAALPDSLLIPLHELNLRWHEIDPPQGALVVVYCHHGIRSLSGAAFLSEAGVPQVVSLTGGIDAWAAEIDPRLPRY